MQKLKKSALMAAGSLSLGLGIIGILLPLLPTTPFLLLAAACYARSSGKLYQCLVTNKFLGKYIQNIRKNKGIPLKAKVTAVLVLWLSIGYSAFLVVHSLWLRLIILLIASYITWYILSFKTLRD